MNVPMIAVWRELVSPAPRASGERDRGEVMGPYPCTCCNDRIGGHRKERELTTQLLLVTEGRQYGRIVLDRD